jgi:DNA-binding NarL/FixJ family response regulator
MKQLFHKLGVSTRTQVVIRAMDLGLHETPAISGGWHA